MSGPVSAGLLFWRFSCGKSLLKGESPAKGPLWRGWPGGKSVECRSAVCCNERKRSCHNPNSCPFAWRLWNRERCAARVKRWGVGLCAIRTDVRRPCGERSCLARPPWRGGRLSRIIQAADILAAGRDVRDGFGGFIERGAPPLSMLIARSVAQMASPHMGAVRTRLTLTSGFL
jgi:hypothetical protein